MGGGVLTLDQIWSATSTFTVKWSEGIESNKAHRVLHYLLCRLYDEGRGQLVNARLTLAQTTLSKKLGISRQWIGDARESAWRGQAGSSTLPQAARWHERQLPFGVLAVCSSGCW